MPQSISSLDSLLITIVLATLALGLPILLVLSFRFLWDRSLHLGRSKELEKLIWQLHRIATAMEHQLHLTFPAVQPGTEEPRDLAYLQQLPAQPAAATQSAPTRAAAAASSPAAAQSAVQQPPAHHPTAPPPTPDAQEAPLPALERREPSAEAPRAGVNSMFGI
jgi:hypothetical protein